MSDFETEPSALVTNLCSESFTLLVLMHGIRYSRPRRSISDMEFTEKKPLSTSISPSLDPTTETVFQAQIDDFTQGFVHG